MMRKFDLLGATALALLAGAPAFAQDTGAAAATSTGGAR